MNNIKKTSDIVKEILKYVPQTRNNDMLLYYEVCKAIDKTVLKLPFWVVILDLKGHGIPPFETVRRTRQKVQQCCPELAACEDVKAMRTVQEEKYKSYARKVMV